MTRFPAIVGALLALAASRGAAADPPEAVRLGQLDVSVHLVVAAVVEQALTRLGHDVALTTATHGELYPLLGEGAIDLLAVGWLPGAHGSLWQRVKDRAVELATVYDGARLLWVVPDYVPADLVAGVADLAKPEVARRMADVIHGPPVDSGLSIASMRIVEHYRLGDQYRYMPGDAATWFGSFTEALPDRRWVVIPMADPRWLARAHPIRVLNEPAGLLGAPNRAVLLASQRFVARAPEATLAALRRIKLDIADVSDMDYRVHVLNLTAKAAAQAWMADHPELVESWF